MSDDRKDGKGSDEVQVEIRTPPALEQVDQRVVRTSVLAVLLAVLMGFVAQGLTGLIALITNLVYFQRWSPVLVSPGDNTLGLTAILIPIVGGLIVGAMARWGSPAIRGHGIPEAMEQVLFHESRIPARMTWLKPVSSAISIGTGGPFGAEGPIIATGGALGSLLGQLLPITADERKTLLAAGATAGMAATFGAPVSAALLAIELLLFEMRPRSMIPVSLAACAATGVRFATIGIEPAFGMPDVAAPGGEALAVYVVIGAIVGVASVFTTHLVYKIEDCFEHLPIHWMWWPAIGGVVVGVAGVFSPRSLGVGYINIEDIVSGRFAGEAMVVFCIWKFISWSVALGSGTSGGTLAPLFTIGGGLGSILGAFAVDVMPSAGVDMRIAALVGMASIFAGASRALLTSVVFAYETTRQPFGLLPLLGGCAAAYLVSSLMMRTSIMTEKIVRRGQPISTEYVTDQLARARVSDHASLDVATVTADATVASVLAWIDSRAPGARHQGFPVLDRSDRLVGVVTVHDLLEADRDALVRTLIVRPLAVVFEDDTLRAAADLMVVEGVGRLPVVRRDDPTSLCGIVTRSDLLSAHHRRITESRRRERVFGRPRRTST